MTADSPIFSTPLFRHREEAGGRRGDLKPGKIITIEIATVAALLRNDNLKGVGVSIDSDPYAFAEKHSPSGLGSYNHETRRKARGSPHRGRIFFGGRSLRLAKKIFAEWPGSYDQGTRVIVRRSPHRGRMNASDPATR